MLLLEYGELHIKYWLIS